MKPRILSFVLMGVVACFIIFLFGNAPEDKRMQESSFDEIRVMTEDEIIKQFEENYEAFDR